jgi:hypothetical protein
LAKELERVAATQEAEETAAATAAGEGKAAATVAVVAATQKLVA